ncbi:MAG: hypothetical protein ACOCRO_04540 [Halanaerobiales bacterium]
MPLPFILAGAAAVAGIAGIAKGAESVSKNSEAKKLNQEAKSLFENSKEQLEITKNNTVEELVHLGKLKLNIWDKQLGRFVTLFTKVKNINLEGQAVVDESLSNKIEISSEELVEMKEMSIKAGEIVSSGFSSLGAGAIAGVASYGGAMMFASASTGTAISALSGVAATNATLAWFGGGSLAAGGLGMAGGAAVLGGIVAGPVIAVGGMLMAAKARKNLVEAKKTYAKTKRAVEEMKTAISLLESIEAMSAQFTDVIQDMSDRMTIVLNKLEESLSNFDKERETSILFRIKKFVFNLFGRDVHIDYSELNQDIKSLMHMTYQFAQTLKILLETPILKEDGTLDPECSNVLEPSYQLLEAAVNEG